MSDSWTIFVEGKSDSRFLLCLLEHYSINNIEIERLGGGASRLPTLAPTIRRRHDGGHRIAVLLDADHKPERTRLQFQQQRDSLQLPISDDDLFLLPNDVDQGDLETLLEQISVAQYRGIYDCFDRYENCLLDESELFHLPNSKARIFAYCETLNIETHANKRDYGDSGHWDLAAPALVPLKKFLLGLHAKRE